MKKYLAGAIITAMLLSDLAYAAQPTLHLDLSMQQTGSTTLVCKNGLVFAETQEGLAYATSQVFLTDSVPAICGWLKMQFSEFLRKDENKDQDITVLWRKFLRKNME